MRALLDTSIFPGAARALIHRFCSGFANRTTSLPVFSPAKSMFSTHRTLSISAAFKILRFVVTITSAKGWMSYPPAENLDIE